LLKTANINQLAGSTQEKYHLN